MRKHFNVIFGTAGRLLSLVLNGGPSYGDPKVLDCHLPGYAPA